MKNKTIVLALLSGLLMVVPAMAQVRHEAKKEVPAETAKKGNFPFLPTPQSQSGTISDFLSNLADIDGAITLSTQIPSLQDPVGNACWRQFAGISALIKAHPLPLNMKVASDIEAGRLLTIALNQVCANPNCSAMWQDASNTSNALIGLPIPISMGSICSKIPVISTNAVPTSPNSTPIPVGTEPVVPITPAPTK